MQAKTYIPRRLDDQWKIGWWDIDVALPFLFCFFLGFMVNHGVKGMVGGAIVGALLSRLVSRIKADKHPAFAWHWTYWHLPEFFTRMRATPPSHVRRMIG
jgi:conjugal transfer pilus assembly protein TraL